MWSIPSRQPVQNILVTLVFFLAYLPRVAAQEKDVQIRPDRHKGIARFQRWVIEPPLKELMNSLLQAPEINPFPEETVALIAERTKAIHEETRKDQAAFVNRLKKERPDLAGFPFLPEKRWNLEKSRAMKRDKYRKEIPSSVDFVKQAEIEKFWQRLKKKSPDLDGQDEDALRLLNQIFMVGNQWHRLGLVEHLKGVKHPYATRALVQRALFDLDAEVRQKARAGLQRRNPAEVAPLLLAGLRFPWPPPAFHAARAMVELGRDDLVPRLAALLDEPPPGAPFFDKAKKQYLVRELVRVNHHRNCLLCHPPSYSKNDPMRGRIPNPFSPLQDSYEEDRPGNMIRADRTYLHPDFSAILPVPSTERPNVPTSPWPYEQRYDFLVRVRALDGLETLLLQDQDRQRYFPREHQFAVINALRGLTGLEGGLSPARWKKLLAKKK